MVSVAGELLELQAAELVAHLGLGHLPPPQVGVVLMGLRPQTTETLLSTAVALGVQLALNMDIQVVAVSMEVLEVPAVVV